jgi:deoxycytidylate deaminase
MKTLDVKSNTCVTQEKSDKNEATFNAIFSSYRNEAKRRQLEFSISKTFFKDMAQQDCAYCGAPPSTAKTSAHDEHVYSGIDRIRNDIGYIEENCAPCCTRCSFFKSSMDNDTFIETISAIYKHNTIKNGFKESKLHSYFKRATVVAENSHDSETRVGAILINRGTGSVIAEGFNGFVRGAPDNKLPTKRPEKYAYIQHAELNLLCNAARLGIAVDDCILVCTLSPCINCIRMLYQAGVKEIYFKDEYKDFKKSVEMRDLDIHIKSTSAYTRLTVKPRP